MGTYPARVVAVAPMRYTSASRGGRSTCLSCSLTRYRIRSISAGTGGSLVAARRKSWLDPNSRLANESGVDSLPKVISADLPPRSKVTSGLFRFPLTRWFASRCCSRTARNPAAASSRGFRIRVRIPYSLNNGANTSILLVVLRIAAVPTAPRILAPFRLAT
ncbi:hypothetical protein BMS3Bbin04_01100 [bacterium BMS3Bbin04]|nr:hypothetical protein BMS3Bbin04_01100 [bacterium BMS3Bbin04]